MKSLWEEMQSVCVRDERTDSRSISVMFNSVCMYILNESDTRRKSWGGWDESALGESTSSKTQGGEITR